MQYVFTWLSFWSSVTKSSCWYFLAYFFFFSLSSALLCSTLEGERNRTRVADWVRLGVLCGKDTINPTLMRQRNTNRLNFKNMNLRGSCFLVSFFHKGQKNVWFNFSKPFSTRWTILDKKPSWFNACVDNIVFLCKQYLFITGSLLVNRPCLWILIRCSSNKYLLKSFL